MHGSSASFAPEAAGSGSALTGESRPSEWLSYGVLLCGVGAAVASAYLVFSTYSPLPNWDEWALFDHLTTHQGWSLGWLWAQHNEHRFLFSKLFFLIDVYAFHGRQAFLLACIFAVQLVQLALLSYSLRVLGDLRGAAWRTGTGLIAYCVFCPTQQENFVWGFELNFVLPAAMATCSLLALLLHSRRPGAWRLVVCIGAATVATWSLSNGMLLWPLLLVLALWLRRRRTAVAVLLAAAANIACFMYHYQLPSAPSGRLGAWEFPGETLKYFLVYFGSTWLRHPSGWAAVGIGATGVCAAALAIGYVVRQRRSALLLPLELAGLMGFCIATAAITASGRLHLGVAQAAASRYQTFALLFWCSLGLSALFYLARNSKRLAAASAVLLAIFLGFATQVRLPFIDAQWHQVRLSLISAALISGVHDPAVLTQAYPAANIVLRDAEYMKQHRLSIFAGSEYSQFGQPLTSVYRLTSPERCSGYISSSQPEPSDAGEGMRLAGFAWDRERQAAVRSVVAVSQGVISGLGTSITIPAASAKATPDADAARTGWVAFLREKAAPATLYGLVGKHGDSACPFASVPAP